MKIGYYASIVAVAGMGCTVLNLGQSLSYADSPQKTERHKSKSKIENQESRVQRLKERAKTKQELDQAKLSELKSIDLDRLKEEAKKLQNQGK